MRGDAVPPALLVGCARGGWTMSAGMNGKLLICLRNLRIYRLISPVTEPPHQRWWHATTVSVRIKLFATVELRDGVWRNDCGALFVPVESEEGAAIGTHQSIF